MKNLPIIENSESKPTRYRGKQDYKDTTVNSSHFTEGDVGVVPIMYIVYIVYIIYTIYPITVFPPNISLLQGVAKVLLADVYCDR